MEKSWREKKLELMRVRFGGIAEEFSQHDDDDRAVYAHMYQAIVEALESLPEEPVAYVRTAMNQRIQTDIFILDTIREAFDGREE